MIHLPVRIIADNAQTCFECEHIGTTGVHCGVDGISVNEHAMGNVCPHKLYGKVKVATKKRKGRVVVSKPCSGCGGKNAAVNKPEIIL